MSASEETVIADTATVRSFCGYHRIWRMTIPTTWPSDVAGTMGISVYHVGGSEHGAYGMSSESISECLNVCPLEFWSFLL